MPQHILSPTRVEILQTQNYKTNISAHRTDRKYRRRAFDYRWISSFNCWLTAASSNSFNVWPDLAKQMRLGRIPNSSLITLRVSRNPNLPHRRIRSLPQISRADRQIPPSARHQSQLSKSWSSDALPSALYKLVRDSSARRLNSCSSIIDLGGHHKLNKLSYLSSVLDHLLPLDH